MDRARRILVITITMPNIELPTSHPNRAKGACLLLQKHAEEPFQAGRLLALPKDERHLLVSPPPPSSSPLSKEWSPRAESPPVSQAELVHQTLLLSHKHKLTDELGCTVDGVTYRLATNHPTRPVPYSPKQQADQSLPHITVTLCPEQ